MLLVCMITVMANYGIRNGPKNTNMSIYRNGLRLLETARLFYTETNPQKRTKKKKKITGGPYTAKGYAV